MTVQISKDTELQLKTFGALKSREWRLDAEYLMKPEKLNPVKVEMSRILLPMPLLFLAGFFLGIATMLAIRQ